MASLKVLLVDDEKNIRQTLKLSLSTLGCEVSLAESAEEALKLLRGERFDLLLTDFRLGGKSGLELIRDCKGLAHSPIIVIMTAYASFENAVSAIQAGAFDYLPKPFSSGQLDLLLKKVATLVEIRRENERLKSQTHRLDYFEGMISPAMLRLEDWVVKIAATEATVLLTGESGTGKTELAHLIHAKSDRSHRTLVIVNCATLTETLLETELFGHVKGAFTGATHDHIGKLELAQGGTLLIDEVGELSPSAQARLLRFLQERVVERVGGNKPISLDVRVIAATNKKLAEAVEAGAFREDLYYRLNAFECDVVPLRHRREDIPVLIKKFTRGKILPDLILKRLLEHSWPGNIRELKNALERLEILAGNREPSIDDLPETIRVGTSLKPQARSVDLRTIDDVVKEHIENILAVEPNQERASEILGITTVTLWRKRKEYGLP